MIVGYMKTLYGELYFISYELFINIVNKKRNKEESERTYTQTHT